MKRNPLFVFAFDAGDPELLVEWASEGALPNLMGVMRRGFWSKTAGPDLINEHGAFVSLFSGVSCHQHGYYYSRQLRPGTYDLFTTSSRDAQALPFWSHLRGMDLRVGLIDVTDTLPIAGLPGVQVCDWATHNPRGAPATEPAELLHEVRKVFGARIRIVEEPEANAGQDRKILRRILECVERRGALCRHLLLNHGPFDLMATAFAESHAGAHQFWPYFTGERNGGSELRSAIRTIYSAIDRELGALLQLLPENANVFVVSSVGIQQQYPIYHIMEDFCRKLGYQAAPPPGNVSFKPMDVVRRWVPESWRIAVSRNFSRQTRERLLADQFRSRTDWSGTTVFAIPSTFTGLLRVNLRGREPHGTVEAGTAYHKLLERVTSDLRELVDPVTREAAVDEAVITMERFGADPPLLLPDVFVLWKAGRHFMERLQHPKVELTQKKPEFSRDTHHSQNGFVAAAGPNIAADGDRGEVALLDLAPTFLSLLGAPIPEALRGAPLRLVAGHV